MIKKEDLNALEKFLKRNMGCGDIIMLDGRGICEMLDIIEELKERRKKDGVEV